MRRVSHPERRLRLLRVREPGHRLRRPTDPGKDEGRGKTDQDPHYIFQIDQYGLL